MKGGRITANGNDNYYKIFSGTANKPLAKAVSKYLKKPLGKIVVGTFPNGETRVEIKESVRGRDIFVIQPTCPPTNDNLMELILIIDALRRSSAASITAIVPYFGYAKQDKRKSGREPISARVVANLLERAGMDRIVCLDLHAPQIEGYFDTPVENLAGVWLFGEYFKKMKDIVVVAPDAGGMKRARDLANRINAQRLAVIDKYRPTYRSANAMNVIGKVGGMNTIIIDDFIDTGGSIVEAIHAVKNHGAKKIYVAVTHPLLTPPAKNRLRDQPVEEYVFTDTIAIAKERMLKNARVLSCAPMLGETIKRIMRKHSLHNYRPQEK